MQTSKSSKWDPTVGAHVPYDKHNVLSTEMAGGDMCVRSAASAFFACAQRIGPSPLLRYYSAPLLHQYAVAFVRSIVNHVSVLQSPFFRCFFRLIYLICRPELSKCVLERQCRQAHSLYPTHSCTCCHTSYSTKLAVCTGDGSHFDKHYDNACLPPNSVALSSESLCIICKSFVPPSLFSIV